MINLNKPRSPVSGGLSPLIAIALAVPAVFVYRGSRVARIITWVLAGLFLPSLLVSILEAGATFAAVVGFLLLLVMIAVVALLATPAANEYFRRTTPGRAQGRRSDWLKLGGGVLAALGTFLPWIDFGFASYNGFDPDVGSFWGPLILVLGVVVVSISTLKVTASHITTKVTASHITTVVLAALLTVAALTKFADTVINYANVIGPGVFAVLLGALAALIGSLPTLRSALSR
jgi:hypothetical protein